MQRFGQVEFGGLHGRLRVAGRDVKLDRASRAVLAVLVDHAGQDVSKDRLLEAGWPGRLVDENSLAKAISRLRQALGDAGDALETVHGHGYRLSTDVEAVRPDEPRARRRRSPAVAVVVAVFALLAILGIATLPGEAHSDAGRPVRNGEPADSLGRVLWVDDNPANNHAETRYLEDRRIAVYHVSSTQEALTLLAMYEYGAVISDMGRGQRPLAGIDLLKTMRARGDARPFVLYTVYSSPAQRQLVSDAGGQAVAVTPEELYAAVFPVFGVAAPDR